MRSASPTTPRGAKASPAAARRDDTASAGSAARTAQGSSSSRDPFFPEPRRPKSPAAGRKGHFMPGTGSSLGRSASPMTGSRSASPKSRESPARRSLSSRSVHGIGECMDRGAPLTGSMPMVHLPLASVAESSVLQIEPIETDEVHAQLQLNGGNLTEGLLSPLVRGHLKLKAEDTGRSSSKGKQPRRHSAPRNKVTSPSGARSSLGGGGGRSCSPGGIGRGRDHATLDQDARSNSSGSSRSSSVDSNSSVDRSGSVAGGARTSRQGSSRAQAKEALSGSDNRIGTLKNELDRLRSRRVAMEQRISQFKSEQGRLLQMPAQRS